MFFGGLDLFQIIEYVAVRGVVLIVLLIHLGELIVKAVSKFGR
jgi:hypothetical protein